MHRVARRVRFAAALVALAAGPASAQEILNADAAQRFVVGRQFQYNCFDGTDGAGRIFADGSVVGTIRPGGRGVMRHVRLPPGTLFVNGDRICARLRGLPFEPCFDVTRTSDSGFRGSLTGFLGFMSCDFDRGGRTQVVRRRAPETPLRGILAGGGPGTP
jgi:hypothetical protein